MLLRLFTDSVVRRYLGGVLSADRAQARISDLFAEASSTWVVVPKHEPTLSVGLVRLHPAHDGVETELSYALLPEVFGQGLATETVGCIVHHAFDRGGISRLIAETQSANKASCQLLERLSFRFFKETMRFDARQTIYVHDGHSRNDAW
ncbi:Acetyltransferase (GNAT) domain-containing protein [Xaviernesmea oryzae]|nr:Acetyltransferase (GNAT) domain-containing protein [Xaviernesmea oryzae]